MVAESLKELLEEGIASGVAPGMACAVGDVGTAHCAYAGTFTFEKGSQRVTEDTLWDLASLTKVIVTTNLAMQLNQTGEIDLDDRVQRTVAEFVGDDKHEVTLRHLLQHTSGLAAYKDYSRYTNALEVKDEILRSDLESPPGTKEVYSCLGFIALAEALQRIAKQNLDALFYERIAGPLGLQDTFYKPAPDLRALCAPTEATTAWRTRLEDMRGFKRPNESTIQGAVHDPIAFLTGGISGNAGLFSTLHDTVKVAQTWLGCIDKDEFFKQSTLRLFTTKGSFGTHGLGFDTKSVTGSQFGDGRSPRTFGHTGFTGTRLWCDPETGHFGILLTNRVHPTSDNLRIKEFSPAFFDRAVALLP